MRSLMVCDQDGVEWVGSHDDWLTWCDVGPGPDYQPWRMPSSTRPVARCWDGGGLVELRIPRDVSAGPLGGRRGIIRGFSAASRGRLLRALAKLRRGTMPVFVTLTYPREWPFAPRTWRAHHDAFRKRLLRRWPGAAYVWRLEFQKRGAPHWHMLVYGVPYAELLAWISQAWYEVVASGDPRHLAAGTRVEEIRSWRGVMSYAAKYMGKSDTESRPVGRLWGIIGRERLPWAALLQVELYGADHWTLRRYMSRYSRRRPYGKAGMSVFADGALWWRLLTHCIGVF